MYYIISIFCLFISGHLGCFHRVGIVRRTTTSVDLVVALEILMSIVLDIFEGSVIAQVPCKEAIFVSSMRQQENN